MRGEARESIIKFKQAAANLSVSVATYSLSNVIYMGGMFASVALMTRIPGFDSDQSKEVLAASGLITTAEPLTAHVAWAALFSLGISVGSRIRQAGNDKAEIGALFQQSLIYAFIMGVPVTVVLAFVGKVYLLLGQSSSLVSIVERYYLPFLIGTIPFIMLGSFEQLALAVGDLKSVIAIAVSYVGLYLALSGAFVFSPLALGIEGFAYARSAAGWICLALWTMYFASSKEYKDFKLFNNHLGRRELLKELVYGGTPIAIQVAAELFGISGAVQIAGALNTDTLAAIQANMQYLNILVIPSITLAQVAGIMVGSHAGSSQFVNAKRLGDTALWIAPIIPILATILFAAAPKFFLSAFLDVDNSKYNYALQLATTMLWINGISQIFDSIRNVSAGNLRGFFDFNVSTAVAIGAMCVLAIGLGFALASKTSLEGVGIIVARGVAILLGSIVMYTRWNQKSKNSVKSDIGDSASSCLSLPFRDVSDSRVDEAKVSLIADSA